MRAKPWAVSDALWDRIGQLLPRRQRRCRYPGRKPFDDRLALHSVVVLDDHARLADAHTELSSLGQDPGEQDRDARLGSNVSLRSRREERARALPGVPGRWP